MIAKKSLGFSFFKLKSGAFTFSKFDVVYTYDIFAHFLLFTLIYCCAIHLKFWFFVSTDFFQTFQKTCATSINPLS